MATVKHKHLPLLYNPLLNSIFNNPIHEKSTLKSTIQELGLAHNDYAILVPPAHILQECRDDSAQKLLDSCYNNDDFVRSHIIKIKVAFSATTAPGSKVQLIIYNTMNGKQVLIKNRMAYTGKGFKKSMKLSIVDVGQFRSFCDYFPKGSRFLVLYIEDTLFGHKVQKPSEPKKEEIPGSKNQTLIGSDVTFERILRTFPVLSEAMSEHFYVLFHHNNRQFQRLRTRRRMPLETISDDFKAVVSETNSIVTNCMFSSTTKGDKAYTIVNAILKEYPHLDMDTLIHEYVELNIYDTVWLQLVFQYHNYKPEDDVGGEEAPLLLLTPALYKDLSCLSLNQLEIPAEEPWIMNVLYKRVSDAIDTFSKLSDPTNSSRSLKVKIVTDTMKILTEGAKSEDTKTRNIVIDADTLIGLSIMVVVHSKVPNLEAHIFYVRHFDVTRHFLTGSADEANESGILNYMLSNFEAVIYHLSNGELNLHLEEMSQVSTLNYQFWSAIQKKNTSLVSKLLDEVNEEYGDQSLPKNHFLRSRNIHGESCFTFAIRSRNSDIFRMLISRTEHWILFEDLVFDMNTSSEQNLLMLALQEEAHDIAMCIIHTFRDTASREEQYLYYNSRDINGRTVGHYLSHDIEALELIGNLIDWKVKDNNSYTPLLSLCRCYDHHDYQTLIQKAFECVANNQKGYITYDDHIDKSGNTLLHVIAKDIKSSGLLSEGKSLIDVNRFNKKYLLPVGVFIRYNRLENLQCLFKDRRLIFDLEDPQNFYNILDYYSFSASRAQNGNLQAIVDIRREVVLKLFSHYFPTKLVIEFGAMNARYDGNIKDWMVNIVYKDSADSVIPFTSKIMNNLADKSVGTRYVPLNQVRQFVKILKIASPLSFAVNPEVFWVNFPGGSAIIPFCSKFRTNRALEHLNLLFLSMNFHSRSSQTAFLQCFKLCCRNEPILVLDFMNDFAHKQEVEKTGVGEVKLSPQKIDEIEYFLNYSKEDLSKYKRQISRLSKLVAVGGVKQCDFRTIFDRFLTALPEVSLSELESGKEARTIDATYHTFESFIMWIEVCVTELLKNCGLVDEKLNRWRQSYARIKEINAELHRFEEQIVVHREEEGNDGPGTISRRSTMSLDAISLEDEESKSTFFGLIDNKKSRYRKILFSKAEEVQKVMDLNVEIKMDHETIAAEISQFLAFRSGFMTFAIKQFTNSALVLLRHRHYEMTKALHKTRKLKKQVPLHSWKNGSE